MRKRRNVTETLEGRAGPSDALQVLPVSGVTACGRPERQHRREEVEKSEQREKRNLK